MRCGVRQCEMGRVRSAYGACRGAALGGHPAQMSLQEAQRLCQLCSPSSCQRNHGPSKTQSQYRSGTCRHRLPHFLDAISPPSRQRSIVVVSEVKHRASVPTWAKEKASRSCATLTTSEWGAVKRPEPGSHQINWRLPPDGTGRVHDQPGGPVGIRPAASGGSRCGAHSGPTPAGAPASPRLITAISEKF